VTACCLIAGKHFYDVQLQRVCTALCTKLYLRSTVSVVKGLSNFAWSNTYNSPSLSNVAKMKIFQSCSFDIRFVCPSDIYKTTSVGEWIGPEIVMLPSLQDAEHSKRNLPLARLEEFKNTG
jgi:hypothetical protein